MLNENVVDYFDRHPANNECHVTSDERIFHTKGTADGHANGLKDNKVNSHYRSDYELMKTDVVAPVIETGETTMSIEDKELRFKLRVDRLIDLGFERIEDNFVNASTSGSITATDVYDITEEMFVVSITPPKVDAPKVENTKPEVDKVYTIEDLKVFDFESGYEAIKAIVKGLSLESASNSKKDLLEAITKAKANLENQS
jgi:hypothetical protein